MARKPKRPEERSAKLDLDAFIREARKFAGPYRIDKGRKFRLKDVDPGDTAGLGSEDKPQAKEALADRHRGARRAAGQALRAGPLGRAPHLPGDGRGRQGRHDQARDVRREPAGLPGAPFKAPSAEELDHDFLWRCMKHLPERGRIGIFNRSYYEEVLVVRVHPEFLAGAEAPAAAGQKSIWEERFRGHPQLSSATCAQRRLVRKFFLHVSSKEQKRRFLERLDEAREELEVLRRRRRGARPTGTTTWRPTRT